MLYICCKVCWETKPHTGRVGELRLIMLVGPEELTLPAMGPKQRSHRLFIDSA